MIRLLFLLFGFVLVLCSCNRTYKAVDPAHKTVSKEMAQRDFEVFKQLIEDGHPAAGVYVTKKRRNFLYDSVYKTITSRLNYYEFYKKLSFITNELGCSHTVVRPPQYIIDTLYNKKVLFPLPLIYIDGKVLVNDDIDLPHGTEIYSIDDRPIKEIMSSLAIFNPVEGWHRPTQQILACRDFGFDYYFNYGGFKDFKVQILDTAKKIQTVTVEAIDLSELYLRQEEYYYGDPGEPTYSFSVNDDEDYARMVIRTMDFDSENEQISFENFLKNSFELLYRKKSINNLIVDVRDNPGGSLRNCFLLYSYLADTDFAEYKAVTSRFSKVPHPQYLKEEDQSGEVHVVNETLDGEFVQQGVKKYAVSDSAINIWEPDEYAYRKKVYVITNPNIFSAASYFALLVKNSGRGKLVGTETAGGDFSGNGFRMLHYELPGTKIELSFPYAKLTYTMGGKNPARGILPDYSVPDNRESFENNEDRQIRFIIDSLINHQ